MAQAHEVRDLLGDEPRRLRRRPQLDDLALGVPGRQRRVRLHARVRDARVGEAAGDGHRRVCCSRIAPAPFEEHRHVRLRGCSRVEPAGARQAGGLHRERRPTGSVAHPDRAQRGTRDLRGLGRDGRDLLTDVPDHPVRERRPVRQRPAAVDVADTGGEVGHGEDGVHPGERASGSGVDAADLGEGVRGAQDGAVQRGPAGCGRGSHEVRRVGHPPRAADVPVDGPDAVADAPPRGELASSLDVPHGEPVGSSGVSAT